jgi:acyl-CoA dehydrogenase
MPDRTFLDWPFFDARHRTLARQAADWWRREGATLPSGSHDPRPVDPSHAGPLADPGGDAWTACREIVRRLGDAGWLHHVVPAAYAGGGGEGGTGRAGEEDRAGGLDVRSLCLLRETFAYGSALADFAFALQGLGSGPLSLFGSEEQRRRYLPAVAAGRAIPAFALSEAGAGSDVTAMRTTARRDGADYVLDGEKTWISNAGIADFYIVFCRLPAGGEKSFAAFVVDAGHPGLRVTERLDVIAPHPLGTLVFAGCRVPAGALVGEPGRGLRVALATLDVFRATVGAAALGLARRALDEALDHARRREVSGQLLGAHQLTQAKLADMATAIDASALLVYRAAWTRDRGAARVTREAAMAKLFATEAAQRVIDDAVQLLGARGVLAGSPVERLYREVRALRIYEGTSEIQRLVIAGQLLAAAADERAPRAQEQAPVADPHATLAHGTAAAARDQASAANPPATRRGEAATAGGPAIPASSSASPPRADRAEAVEPAAAADASILAAEGAAPGPSTPERRPA